MKTIILKIMNKRFLGFICLVILIGFFFAGLWPFNFISENEVKWLKDSNGISFYGNGMIPFKWGKYAMILSRTSFIPLPGASFIPHFLIIF